MPKVLVAVQRQRTVGKAVESFLAMDNGRPTSRAFGILDGRFHSLRSGVCEKHLYVRDR